MRTVVITRELKGATKDYYTFAPDTVATLNYIAAVGSSDVLAYHAVHDSLTLSFANPTGPTCVCDGGLQGKLCAYNGTACSGFTKGCVGRSATLGAKGEDSGDLLAMRNPTCNAAQYAGGLTCCKHKRIMLDEDQIVPPELLRYHMKFR